MMRLSKLVSPSSLQGFEYGKNVNLYIVTFGKILHRKTESQLLRDGRKSWSWLRLNRTVKICFTTFRVSPILPIFVQLNACSVLRTITTPKTNIRSFLFAVPAQSSRSHVAAGDYKTRAYAIRRAHDRGKKRKPTLAGALNFWAKISFLSYLISDRVLSYFIWLTLFLF